MKNIIVAFTDHPTAQKIRTILTCNGFVVAGVCTSGAQVLSLARRLQEGGVILCSSKFHDMNTEFLAEQLSSEYDFLMLLHSNEGIMDGDRGIYSLQLPLRKSDLLASVRMLLTTGRMRSAPAEPEDREAGTRREEKTERSPADKQLIDKAKVVLMERNNLSEDQAHRFLQKCSMDNGKKLTDTARAIIEGW